MSRAEAVVGRAWRCCCNPNSHSIAPVDDFIFVGSNLKPLSELFVTDNGDVGQPLLACKRAGQVQM